MGRFVLGLMAGMVVTLVIGLPLVAHREHRQGIECSNEITTLLSDDVRSGHYACVYDKHGYVHCGPPGFTWKEK